MAFSSVITGTGSQRMACAMGMSWPSFILAKNTAKWLVPDEVLQVLLRVARVAYRLRDTRIRKHADLLKFLVSESLSLTAGVVKLHVTTWTEADLGPVVALLHHGFEYGAVKQRLLGFQCHIYEAAFALVQRCSGLGYSTTLADALATLIHQAKLDTNYTAI